MQKYSIYLNLARGVVWGLTTNVIHNIVIKLWNRNQGITLNSPINMRHSNCAVWTDPFHLISESI